MIEIEKYKNHDIVKNGDEYRIIWDRGKKYFGYNVNESLAEKSRKSDKDALEVMFYLENKRWPKEYELENYNKSNIKKHVGNQFMIYEEDGKYEISFEKESGGVSLGDVCYPITKELMEKAFKSDRDAYEVKIYAETGSWPTNDRDEKDRDFIREFPELVLKNPERCKVLFSEEEYNYLEEDYSEALKKFGKINKSQVEKIYANSTRDTGYIATGNSFDINRAFRNKEPNLLREVDLITSKTLDEVIKSNKTPYNIKGFRKVNLDWVSSFIENANIPKTYDSIQDVSDALNSIRGHRYEELAYSSISVNPKMNVFSNRRVQLDIEIPKGSNAYLTLNVQESELIMGRGTIFELKESSVVKDDYEEILKITLRVIK